jgi:hypothetical protein
LSFHQTDNLEGSHTRCVFVIMFNDTISSNVRKVICPVGSIE